MRGPCLCGDPYCSSCGDPELAKFEEAMEKLQDDIEGKKMSEPELALFVKAGFAAVDAHREIVTAITAEIKAYYSEIIVDLRHDNDLLQDLNKALTQDRFRAAPRTDPLVP